MFVPVPYPEIEFEKSTFKGGEQHLKLNMNIDYSKVEKVIITHRIQSAVDTMHIMEAYDALCWLGVEKFDLIIPYVPYARQDRICAPGESFSLNVFAKMINLMKFERIHILDSHSDVAPALLSAGQNRCINHDNTQYVEMAIKDIHSLYNSDPSYSFTYPILVSPDSGSNKKINKIFDKLHENLSIVVKCDKRRNMSDGSLSGFEVLSNNIGNNSGLDGAPCLIVDDIADGGRTFLGLAEELKKQNAGDIYLFVTHGIFSYGFDELKKYFKKIYCTNSFNDIKLTDINHDLVKQFKIQL